MNKIRLTKTPQFLTHHIPLRADKMARLTLPTDLTFDEAERLTIIVQALVTEHDEFENGIWPYPYGADPDGDLDADEIQASVDELNGEDESVAVVQNENLT